MDGEYYINSGFEVYNTVFPNAIREMKYANGILTGIVSKVELYDKYKIRLLKLEHSKPTRK